MTTLYKPVLIESVEQAGALPEGTVAIHKVAGWMAVRVQFGGGLFWREGRYEAEGSDLVGWTALVPIEAEEETAPPPFSRRTRYVTAWEEA